MREPITLTISTTSSGDLEIDAMQVVVIAMTSLSNAEQSRVAAWVADRYRSKVSS